MQSKDAHKILLKHSHNVRKRDESDSPIYGALVPYSECINAMNECASVEVEKEINAIYQELLANNILTAEVKEFFHTHMNRITEQIKLK